MLGALAACGGPPEVAAADLTAEQEAACAAFVAALPDTLADHERTGDVAGTATGAAYDGGLWVACGVPAPEGFDLTAQCDIVNGVGWYYPPEQVDTPDSEVSLSTPGYDPVVEARVPGGDGRGDDAAAVMAELAPLVDAHLTLVEACAGVGD